MIIEIQSLSKSFNGGFQALDAVSICLARGEMVALIGTTVMVSLHQVDFARRFCARTVALSQGRVVYDGPTVALTPAMLQELYGADATELLQPAIAPAAEVASSTITSHRLRPSLAVVA